MNSLTIGVTGARSETMISNNFIEEYMPGANGEYVKIYLYLMKLVQENGPVSMEDLEDKLGVTSKYILSALRYWEKRKLLSVGTGEDGSLEHIEFLEVPSAAAGKKKDREAPAAKEQAAAAAKETAAASQTRVPVRRTYSADEKTSFLGDEGFCASKFITESYFGRPLGPTQLESLIYIYDQLHFDQDMIDCLIEHCASRGKFSMRYAEATAIAWKEQGIESAAQARASIQMFSSLYGEVAKAFGINRRGLVPKERQYIDKWVNQYGFDREMIVEACAKTIRQTNNGSFEYADAILVNWHKEGISTVVQARSADKQRQAQRQPKTSQKGHGGPGFSQRSYDMDDLERKLLGQSQQ